MIHIDIPVPVVGTWYLVPGTGTNECLLVSRRAVQYSTVPSTELDLGDEKVLILCFEFQREVPTYQHDTVGTVRTKVRAGTVRIIPV